MHMRVNTLIQLHIAENNEMKKWDEKKNIYCSVFRFSDSTIVSLIQGFKLFLNDFSKGGESWRLVQTGTLNHSSFLFDFFRRWAACTLLHHEITEWFIDFIKFRQIFFMYIMCLSHHVQKITKLKFSQLLKIMKFSNLYFLNFHIFRKLKKKKKITSS